MCNACVNYPKSFYSPVKNEKKNYLLIKVEVRFEAFFAAKRVSYTSFSLQIRMSK